MDLSIYDVARLLNVTTATIESWVKNGLIPSYNVAGKSFFSHMEIEEWVMTNQNLLPTRIEEEAMFNLDYSQKFNLYRSIYHGTVYRDLEGSKTDIISATVSRIAKEINLDANVLEELFLDRENMMPTALNDGVAVPHARDIVFQGTYDVIVVVYPKKPIPYGSLDDKDVHTMFFIFASEDKKHLHLLAKIAHFCQNSQNIEFLKQKPSKENLLSHIKHWENCMSPLATSGAV